LPANAVLQKEKINMIIKNNLVIVQMKIDIPMKFLMK
jgi:hypothetical protein